MQNTAVVVKPIKISHRFYCGANDLFIFMKIVRYSDILNTEQAAVCWPEGLSEDSLRPEFRFRISNLLKQLRARRASYRLLYRSSYRLLKHTVGIKPTSFTCIHCSPNKRKKDIKTT